MEQIWSFVKTICGGFKQGVRLYFENDFQDYLPLYVITGVLLIMVLVNKLIRKIKNKKEQ